MAIEAGASAVGLVSPMPSGPGPISNEKAAEIAAEVPPGIDAFLLTPLQTVEELVEQNRLVKARALQLVDALPQGAHAELRRAMPGVKLVQVIHVTGPESVNDALKVAPDVDAILLDSGNPSLEVKELGGTGRRHDWALSREIRERIDVPLWLAGGLNPDNARAGHRHRAAVRARRVLRATHRRGLRPRPGQAGPLHGGGPRRVAPHLHPPPATWRMDSVLEAEFMRQLAW